MLAERGLTPVVLGTAPERPLARAIPGAIDLTGRTDLAQLTSLARGARIAIGNDTGPMHLIAAAGCPSVVLFSRDSDPALCAPRGPAVQRAATARPRRLEVATVIEAAATTCCRRPRWPPADGGSAGASDPILPPTTAFPCRSATGRS